MQEICAEADISAGALYRYFASKAEIISAIAEDKRQESDEAFLRTAEKSGAIAAVCQAGEDFFTKCAEGDGALIADIIAEAIRDEAIADALRGANDHGVKKFIQVIVAAQGRGEIDATLDPEIAANTLLGALEGIALRRALLRQSDSDAALSQFRALAERYLKPQS